MGMYKAKPTLLELYTEDSTIFSGLTIPASLNVDTLKAVLLQELGELQTVFKDAASIKAYLPAWSAIHAVPWARMLSALSASYNPIHNYDRTDEETEEISGTESETSTGSMTDERTASRTTSGTETVTPSGSNVTVTQRAGFNSVDFVNSDKATETPGTVMTTADSGSISDESDTSVSTSGGRDSEESKTRTRTLTSSGNIGVTTAQQMITAEVDMRRQLEMYSIITQSFKCDLCVGVW